MKLFMPTLVYSETDCVKKHAAELAALGNKALIVTGRHSSKANGSLKAVTDALESEKTEYLLFDEIEENPSIETVMNARKIGVDGKVDFVIGIGGGSPMDAAKAIALMIANPQEDKNLLYEARTMPALPVAEVPTTAGTGSEVTPYAILTIHEKKTKKSISHKIFPKIALCDTNYIKTQSYEGTVNTAVDTLAHLVESYLNTNSNAYNRTYSERGLAVWGQFKDALLENKLSKEDYDKMMQACTYGGMAISHTGTSFPHGLSYMVTYHLGTPHGKAVGIFLAGYVKCYAANDPKDAQKVLELLGFANVEDMGAYLHKLLGDVEVSAQMTADNAEALLANPGKLANYPFLISEEELLMMKMY